MSLTKTSVGKNHLSARQRKNLLPFRLASQSDLSSAVVSITSFGVPVSSGGPVATSIFRKQLA
jgi:hypothetical protein